MTAKHNKGSILQAVEESAFAVDPGTGYIDLRIEGDPTVGGQFSNNIQPNTLKANPNDTDNPILVDTGAEGALSYQYGIRRAATAGLDASLVPQFKSAGWEEDSGSDTTVGTATSQTSIILDADEGDPGRMQVVELNDGKYWPVLVSSKSTTTVTFACGLPSVTGVGNDVNKCHTLYPGAVGPSSTSLTYRNITKAKDGSNNNVMEVYTGCSVSAIADLQLIPGTPAYFNFTVNATTHNPSSIASMPANSFRDGEGMKPVDKMWVQFADANASGAIATATTKILEATVSFGGVTVPIRGIGDAECINNLQGNNQNPGPFVFTLKFLYESARITDWEGTNTDKYIGLVQPSNNMTQAPWAFITPNCHIMEPPVWTPYGDENMQIVDIKYKANPAGYNSETLESDKANQPIYFGIGTKSS